jgi:hypothetical protein
MKSSIDDLNLSLQKMGSAVYGQPDQQPPGDGEAGPQQEKPGDDDEGTVEGEFREV